MSYFKLLVFTIFANFVQRQEAACLFAWRQRSSTFCYQNENRLNPYTFEAYTGACGLLNSSLPAFQSDAEYAEFYLDWSGKGRPVFNYQHDVGVRYNLTDIVSEADHQVLKLTNPFRIGSEPDFNMNKEWCVEWDGGGAGYWRDNQCSSLTDIICQQYQVLDNVSYTVPCSPLCQSLSKKSNHRFYSTNSKRCQTFGTEENNLVGYAMTVSIPTVSDTVFEMWDSANNSAMIYGTTAASAAQSVYKVQRTFFVLNTAIANNVSLYAFMHNGTVTSNSDTMIVSKSSLTYSALVAQNWTEVSSFYLFTTMNANFTCSLALDCQWGLWTAWSACSLTCGQGIQVRSRSKTTVDSRGGSCDNIYNQTETCTIQPCGTNCTWNAWIAWSTCSMTCATGTQTRTRTKNTVETLNGVCDNIYTAIQNCTITQCPIDCVWNTWQAWSSCSVTCSSGTQTRLRTKNVTEAYGGACDNISTDVLGCTNFPCPIDCVWNSWQSWTTCSVTCEGGYQSRIRDKQVVDANGGNCDNIYEQNQTCNTDLCFFSDPATAEVMNATGLREALTDQIALSGTIEDNVQYATSSITTTEKMQMGFQVKDNIRNCMFGQKYCQMDRDFKLFNDPTLGNCFTFNYPLQSFYVVKRAGESFGLAMLLYAYQDDYLCSTSRAGFRVLMHEPSTYPFVDNIGIEVPPGYISSLHVLQEKTSLLPPPYGNCISSSNKNDPNRPYYYDGNYSTEGCIRSCFQSYVIKSCGCGDPRYPVPTGTDYCGTLKKPCVESVSKCEHEMGVQTCNCPPACSETQYYATITNAALFNSPMLLDYCSAQNSTLEACLEYARTDFALLQISYNTLNYVSYEENSSYSIIQLWNDFSNVVGLLLGICVITFPELVLFIFKCCSGIAACKNKK